MSPRPLSTDAQATLLLTAQLPGRGDGPNPLTHSEYNRVAVALGENGLRPSSLLNPNDSDRFLSSLASQTIDPDRVLQLLERGFAIGIMTEAWTNAGFWVLSRADEAYPARLRERLKAKAPILLFGCGEPALLNRGGLAIVGSRNIDESGEDFTRDIAGTAAADGIQVISGGARGVDSIAMETALERGGSVVGVLANDLAKTSRSETAREAIQDDRLCLVSPFQPDSRFEAWKAMDRNKSIYALSDWAVVVASDLRKGGTWAGAKEDLDGGWVPLFVRADTGVPKGNEALITMGALPLSGDDVENLRSTLENAELVVREPSGTNDDPDHPQLSLFSE